MENLPMVQSNPLAPKTFEQAMQFSEMAARSELVPKDFRGKPGNILIAMQMGFELGLQPMQAIQNIAVINGRASVWGDAMIALVRASALCEWIKESFDDNSMTATCSGKRRGDPNHQTSTFTKQDAEQARLWGKAGPWSQYPKRMLQMRARGFLLRDLWPDVLKGMITAEEATDYGQDAVVVVRPEPVKVETEPIEHKLRFVGFKNEIKDAGTVDELKGVWNKSTGGVAGELMEAFKTEYIKRLREIKGAETPDNKPEPKPEVPEHPNIPEKRDEHVARIPDKVLDNMKAPSNLNLLTVGLASCFSKDAVNDYVNQSSGALMKMSKADQRSFEQETFERILQLSGSSDLFSDAEASEKFAIIKANINAKRKIETLDSCIASIKDDLARLPAEMKASIVTLIDARRKEITIHKGGIG